MPGSDPVGLVLCNILGASILLNILQHCHIYCIDIDIFVPFPKEGKPKPHIFYTERKKKGGGGGSRGRGGERRNSFQKKVRKLQTSILFSIHFSQNYAASYMRCSEKMRHLAAMYDVPQWKYLALNSKYYLGVSVTICYSSNFKQEPHSRDFTLYFL